jgi:hypothetical protein
MPGTNILAYYDNSKIVDVKSLIILDPTYSFQALKLIYGVGVRYHLCDSAIWGYLCQVKALIPVKKLKNDYVKFCEDDLT